MMMLMLMTISLKRLVKSNAADLHFFTQQVTAWLLRILNWSFDSYVLWVETYDGINLHRPADRKAEETRRDH